MHSNHAGMIGHQTLYTYKGEVKQPPLVLPDGTIVKSILKKRGGNKTRKRNIKGGKWSQKYKKSIDCNHPKGFSQRQHCKYGIKTKKNTKK